MVTLLEEDLQIRRPTIFDVFHTIENNFEKTALGSQRWYIATIAVLVGGNDPEICDQLYLYLISKPEFSTAEQRKALMKRLRETLVKCVSIIGVCKPLEAIMAISKHEREEDKDRTFTREKWQCDEQNLQNGMKWMRRLYGHDTDRTMMLFADHSDFAWISKHITYGLYLSDRQVLDDVDTQMLVLSGIMIQNLKLETHWHIRGTRRIGVSAHDVQIIWDSVQTMASYLNIKLHRVPTVADVEYDI